MTEQTPVPDANKPQERRGLTRRGALFGAAAAAAGAVGGVSIDRALRPDHPQTPDSEQIPVIPQDIEMEDYAPDIFIEKGQRSVFEAVLRRHSSNFTFNEGSLTVKGIDAEGRNVIVEKTFDRSKYAHVSIAGGRKGFKIDYYTSEGSIDGVLISPDLLASPPTSPQLIVDEYSAGWSPLPELPK